MMMMMMMMNDDDDNDDNDNDATAQHKRATNPQKSFVAVPRHGILPLSSSLFVIIRTGSDC